MEEDRTTLEVRRGEPEQPEPHPKPGGVRAVAGEREPDEHAGRM